MSEEKEGFVAWVRRKAQEADARKVERRKVEIAKAARDTEYYRALAKKEKVKNSYENEKAKRRKRKSDSVSNFFNVK